MDSDLSRDQYEVANEAVAFCQLYLMERSQDDAAVYLAGIDQIGDQDGCIEAYQRLRAAQRHVQDRASVHMIRSAMNSVERALRIPTLLAS